MRLGRAELEKNNIWAVRAERERVSAEKKLLRECITAFAEDSTRMEGLDLTTTPAELQVWHRHVRGRSNDLNLS